MSDLQFDMIGCPVCNGEGELLIVFKDRNSTTHRLFKCDHCEDGLISPLPKEIDITINNDKLPF